MTISSVAKVEDIARPVCKADVPTRLSSALFRQLPLALFSSCILNGLEIRDYFSFGLAGRVHRNITQAYFPLYASTLFLKYRILNITSNPSEELAGIIRQCRTTKHEDVALTEGLYPGAPDKSRCYFSQQSWTCAGVVINFDNWRDMAPEIRNKIKLAYQPVDDLLAKTNSHYCGRVGSGLFGESKKILYDLAWKCRQLALPLTSEIIAKMTSDEQIRFEVDYLLYYHKFEEALNVVLRIDNDYGFQRRFYLGYVICAMARANKLPEAMFLIIMNGDPQLKLKFEQNDYPPKFCESFRILKAILQKVWEEGGVSKAIELACLIPSDQWRTQAITYLIFRLTQQVVRYDDYNLTTKRHFEIDINVEQALHLFENYLPDWRIEANLKRWILARRAVYIIDALLCNRDVDGAKKFLPFLNDNKVGDRFFIYPENKYFYTKVMKFYYQQ